MTATEIASALEDASVGVVGTTIFAGQLPASPAACCAVLEYQGRPPQYEFGSASIALEFPRVQIVCRGEPSDYTTPRAQAEDAYRALSVIAHTTIDGTAYQILEPLQSPFLMGKDQNGRLIVGFNVQVVKGLSA